MSQHIHILGICGTFMGGLALLARELGYTVSGSDVNVYPPMSRQLEQAGITLMEGYKPEHLEPAPDLVVIGNALSRGNPAVEAVLDRGLPYTSGPQWLGEALLDGRWVLAVSGTHGKTSTTSMLAWILEYAGMAPGFLVGGVPLNFDGSARVGGSDFFVIEADEYDTAFFDKRSKFVHYRPRTLVIGNLEYDHADIFPDLAAIETQFHHLLRCVPGQGLVLRPPSEAIDRVVARGLWTPIQILGSDASADWSVQPLAPAGECFRLTDPSGQSIDIEWSLIGAHNLANACAAAGAAHHVGVPLAVIAEALTQFKGVKRRLEWRGAPGDIHVFDDFAHHPTAIATTLEAMRLHSPDHRVIAVIEPRSNTMRRGEHRAQLPTATRRADRVFWYQPPGLDWSLDSVVTESEAPASVISDIDALVKEIVDATRPGDRVVIMSNGAFGGLHDRLLSVLEQHAGT